MVVWLERHSHPVWRLTHSGWKAMESQIFRKLVAGGGTVTSDATLLVTNSAYVPQYRIVFKDLYPIALGELDFTSAEPISSPLISNVTFNYTKFEIHNANGNLCDNLLG